MNHPCYRAQVAGLAASRKVLSFGAVGQQQQASVASATFVNAVAGWRALITFQTLDFDTVNKSTLERGPYRTSAVTINPSAGHRVVV